VTVWSEPEVLWMGKQGGKSEDDIKIRIKDIVQPKKRGV
jgi:hypothetical protein